MIVVSSASVPETIHDHLGDPIGLERGIWDCLDDHCVENTDSSANSDEFDAQSRLGGQHQLKGSSSMNAGKVEASVATSQPQPRSRGRSRLDFSAVVADEITVNNGDS